MTDDEAIAFIGFYCMLVKDFKCTICGKICQGRLEFQEHIEKHKAMRFIK